MNKRIKYFATFCLLFLISFCSMAQTGADTEVEMAGLMRSNGKIYVVVAVVLIILIGLLGYVFSVDRKLSRLEKQRRNS